MRAARDGHLALGNPFPGIERRGQRILSFVSAPRLRCALGLPGPRSHVRTQLPSSQPSRFLGKCTSPADKKLGMKL